MRISIRRLRARPSIDVLSAIGLVDPKPWATRRASGIPRAINAARTASARLLLNASELYALVGEDDDASARVEPFEAIELRLGLLWER